jgi:hypothetical protein
MPLGNPLSQTINQGDRADVEEVDAQVSNSREASTLVPSENNQGRPAADNTSFQKANFVDSRSSKSGTIEDPRFANSSINNENVENLPAKTVNFQNDMLAKSNLGTSP